MPVALRADNRALLGLSVAGLLLSLKADGRFPLPASLPEGQFQFLLLPYTVAFLGTLAWATWPAHPFPRWGWLTALLEGITLRRLALSTLTVFEILTALILLWQTRKYAEFGYRLYGPHLAAALAIPALGLAWLWRRRADFRPGQLVFVSATSYAAVSLLSVVSFPLHVGRSDMLPLLVAAGGRLLGGESPYGLYSLPHTVPLTYLPGLLLAYLPAAATGVDARLVHGSMTLGAILFAYRRAPEARRLAAAAGLSAFLLLPYLQYRHEIYLGPHWLSLALTIALASDRLLLASAAFGWSLACSQLSWVLMPLYALHLWRSRGLRAAALGSGLALLTAGALILPFLAWAPADFLKGVLGHWETTVNLSTVNLSYFIIRALSLPALRILQVLLVAVATAAAWHSCASLASTTRWMVATLTAFVLLNSLIWVYFYLTILLLLALAQVVVDEPAGDPERPGRQAAQEACRPSATA